MPEPVTKPSIWQWSDRWAPEVLHADDGTGALPVSLNSPYYYAREILGILFTTTSDATAATRQPRVELSQAGLIYARVNIRQNLIASNTRDYMLQRQGFQFVTGAVNGYLHEGLPDNFLWLPHTTLNIIIANGVAGDITEKVAITSRRWRVG